MMQAIRALWMAGGLAGGLALSLACAGSVPGLGGGVDPEVMAALEAACDTYRKEGDRIGSRRSWNVAYVRGAQIRVTEAGPRSTTTMPNKVQKVSLIKPEAVKDAILDPYMVGPSALIHEKVSSSMHNGDEIRVMTDGYFKDWGMIVDRRKRPKVEEQTVYRVDLVEPTEFAEQRRKWNW